MHCPGSIVKVSSQKSQSDMQREPADLTSKVCVQAGQRCVKGYKFCITFRSLSQITFAGVDALWMYKCCTMAIAGKGAVYVSDTAMMHLVLKTRSLRQSLCLAWDANAMGRAGSAEVALGVTAIRSLCRVVAVRHAGSRYQQRPSGHVATAGGSFHC